MKNLGNDRARMPLHDSGDDGKTQSGARLGTVDVTSVEALEYSVEVPLRYPHTFVHDRDSGFVAK